MHFNEYHDLAQRTAKQYPMMQQNLIHAALGLSTEFMEAFVAFDPEHVKEEIGDYCWYIPVACEALGFKLGDLVAEVLKLDIVDANASVIQSRAATRIGSSLMMQIGAKPTGDFITMVKRVAIYDKDLSPVMVAQAKGYLVNMVQFAAVMAERCGFTLAAALRDNIAKLRERFPDKYTNEAAEARADKGGLDALVS